MLSPLKEMLIRHEGIVLKPYRDSVGLLTIGIGRCIDRVGITREEALYLLDNDVARTIAEARSSFDWFDTLDSARRIVVINMIFNLGLEGFREFRKTIAYIRTGQYEKASVEMLDSTWSKQVKGRATELSEIMRTGVLVS